MTGNLLRQPLVLPEDLLIIPVADLDEDVRGKLGDGGEEFALTRPLARQPSKLVDAAAARLIEQFREPRTIVQAIITYSRTNEADPEQTLEDSLPLLRQLIGNGLLLPEGAAQAHRIEARFSPGHGIGSFRVIRCIQLLEDTELYQARAVDGSFVALKIARPDVEIAGPMRERLEREATVLRRLDGSVSPRLFEQGTLDGQAFLAMEWITGSDAVTVAMELRQDGDREGQAKLFRAIAEAYATLHRHGVLHGDIHPGNLLVRRDGTVRLIDFGFGRIAEEVTLHGPRGGVSFFSEPEYAAALLDRRIPPPATFRSEQFAIAALLYLLATGDHYMDFTLQQEEMLEQIRAAAPLRFSDRRIQPWPELEAALGRALSVEPAARHPDMSRFADALASLQPAPAAPAIPSIESPGAVLDGMLSHLSLDGPLYREGLPHGPLCSVNFGAGGIAYALYHLACQQDDARLLAAADAWIMKAQADAGKEMAFANPEMEMTEATVGRVSPYHSPSGLHLVQALIGEAAGEDAVRDAATNAFLNAIDQPCVERDLTLGICGTVLGCGMLLELRPNASDAIGESLRGFGERQLNALWIETEAFDPLERGTQWPNIGIAHGWAGLLYVTFRWHALTGQMLPAAARDRLTQLIDAARPTGRGASWPWRQHAADDGVASMPGWCNGSAGIVHLACVAARMLADESLLEIAEAAAWHAWEGGDGPVDLCCGIAGRAYALLELHRSVGGTSWLERAQRLASRAAQTSAQQRSAEHPRHSLYKGELGLAVLIADLEQPMAATMPMFGAAGWR